MCIVVVFIILLRGCVNVLSDVGSQNESYCAKLDAAYQTFGPLRSVTVDGEPVQVEVWSGGGAARAAAALMFALVRYGLRYDTKLVALEADLCDLSARAAKNRHNAAVVAPTAFRPKTGCRLNKLDLLTTLKVSAAPSKLLLFVYLEPSTRERCATMASNWLFYENSKSFKNCKFALPQMLSQRNGSEMHSCNDCTIVLARNDSRNDINVANEYKKQYLSQDVKLIFFNRDIELRQALRNLRNQNKSYLFIYENVWSDVEGVYHIQGPSCDSSTENCEHLISFRIGDGLFFEKYAPQISTAVDRFTPNLSTLRQILEDEEGEACLKNITEAACSWAIKPENKDNFESWFLTLGHSTPTYEIIVFLCNGDFDIQYEEIIRATLYIINNISQDVLFSVSKPQYFDCSTVDTLVTTIYSEAERRKSVGIVLWGWINTINVVIDAARNANILLVFAGPVPTEVQLDSTTSRSVSGNLDDLARAYHYFFQMSNWNRVAIISEESDYARSFMKALKSTGSLIYSEKIISKRIKNTLKEYKKLDARIFLLNTKWDTAKRILCEALELDMMDKQYAWITREGYILQCTKSDKVYDIRHYTIGMDWRGGTLPTNVSSLSRQICTQLSYKDKKINEILKNEQCGNLVSPPSGWFLADALVMLTHGFQNFRQNYYTHLFDLHSNVSARLMSQILDNATTIDGVVQPLISNHHYIKDPVVFVDKFCGEKQRSLAVFQVKIDKVASQWLLNEDIFSENGRISDSPYCTISSGDPFAPRCHDIPVLLATIAIILLIAALISARRVRLSQLERRDLYLIGNLLKHREQVAFNLNTYLVDRHLVKLSHEIGSGYFGRVHFGELMRPGGNTVVVAAKVPRENIALEEEREFLHEACLLAPLSHDHVIRLIGICLKDGPPMVLMEHALYLDLQRYLIERRQLKMESLTTTSTKENFIDISDESLTRLARQAAAALVYLTERRIVHRDVRAANCLVDKERSLKLADFGMARHLSGTEPEYASHRRALFPVLWMAPESLEQGVFSPASDVWALGVLILEVVTLGERPFGKWLAARVLRYVESGGHAPVPPDASIYTRNLVTSCWRRNPDDRPSAGDVEQYLKHNPQALSAAFLAGTPSTYN